MMDPSKVATGLVWNTNRPKGQTNRGMRTGVPLYYFVDKSIDNFPRIK